MIAKLIAVIREYVTLAAGAIIASSIAFSAISLAVRHTELTLAFVAGALGSFFTVALFSYFVPSPLSRLYTNAFMVCSPSQASKSSKALLPPSAATSTSKISRETDSPNDKVWIVLCYTSPHHGSYSWVQQEKLNFISRLGVAPRIIDRLRQHEHEFRSVGVDHIWWWTGDSRTADRHDIFLSHADADHTSVNFVLECKRSNLREIKFDIKPYENRLGQVIGIIGSLSSAEMINHPIRQIVDGEAIGAF